MFRRKPLITEDIYGRLMTSFGRVVDLDPFVARPADALAARVCSEHAELSEAIDASMYRGAAHYHLRLLAGAWIKSFDGGVPTQTAEVFSEAVAWKFRPINKAASAMPGHLSALARGANRESGESQDG